MMSFWRRLIDVSRRRRLTRDFDEELRFHRDHIIEERLAEGRSEMDAKHDAQRRLGNTTIVAEDVRTVWGLTWFEHLVQDLRYGLRALRRSAGFTTVAALTLALGIGANTAIFTVLNGVIFRPLPFADPGRVVMLWETMKDFPQVLVSYPNYLDWRGRLRSFEDVALYNGFGSFTLTGMGNAERVRGGLATGNLFSTLGVQPALGRLFAARDDQVAADRVAVITDAFWRQKFAADPAVIGKTLMLDGVSYTIAGVLPPRIRLAGCEVWIPIGLFANTERFASRENHPGTIGVGRLRSGVTLAQMQADLDATYKQLQSEYPKENSNIGASGGFFLDEVLGGIRPVLYVIVAAVGLVLLIACANVANLLLGRASSRQRELSLRLALGARRGRIVRQLLTESVLLSGIGGALGIALAWAGVRVLLSLRPSNVPRLIDIHLDPTVLAFALVLSVVTGIAFGVIPALDAVRGDLVGSIRDGGRGATSGVQRLRVRSALMVTEVALALVLLVSAGLLLRSVQNLTRVDIGADPRNVVAGVVSLPEQKYADADRQAAAFAALLDRVRGIPGVTNAALASDLPLTTSWQSGVTLEGLPPVEPGREPLFNVVIADADWFTTMRMRMLAGRGLASSDTRDSPPVVVISRGIADRLGGPTAAVGKRLKRGRGDGPEPWLTIVGVVNDTKDNGPGLRSRGTLYIPFPQNPTGSVWLAARTSGSASAVVPALRQALAGVDPDLPLADVQTLEDRVATSIAQPRFSMMMLGIFATIALLLAAIGIYGVISYSVAQRTHEIGVRMALGARQVDVVGMVVRQVLIMTASGIAIGGALAVASGRLMTKLLFGVHSSDPVTFVAVALGLAAVALVAAAVPAWQAARLDPVSALRAD
jgi:putative ABC transport system permease protein